MINRTDPFTSRLLVLPLAAAMVIIPASDALAIPPPELVRIGSVFVQVLAFLLVFVSTAGFLIRKRLTHLFATMQRWRISLVFSAASVACVLVALLISSLYVDKKTNLALASSSTTQQTAKVEAGVMTVAGVEFDITDPTHAIAPQQVQKLLSDTRYLFIDIREPVEFTTRHIAGFTNIRAGDLLAGGQHASLDQTKTIVLACEAGERGSAIAVFLKLRGHQARYLDGGIRGWLAADLPISGSRTMQLPDFTNKYKTISREEAEQHLANGRISLIDVRTAKEFNRDHIVGALNIPLVNMPSEKLTRLLETLPSDRPVVGIAHDRFGAYYCLIVGHMLTQRGRSYGGTLMIQQQDQAL